MIPYTTCMRFNARKRSVADGSQQDKYSPSEWTLVQHFDLNTGIINVTSQDDQTLCFTWTLDSHPPFDPNHRDSVTSIASEKQEFDELDEKSLCLLLTLRRRKSLQQSIHSETISLLDLCYYGITERYLRQSYQWNFNTFSLDTLTGGHSLSSLLLYLFKEYDLIDAFKLDLINVMRCFHSLENGYHDTNPYHNSVHAADVTQAMHCFLQEAKINANLTQMEVMCSLLAAVAHDLDHPGVNQNFLVATKSHLAALYNNFSVLESHHWRFALSCFYESHIFDHFDKTQWQEIEFLLKHLILATDISRQSEYIKQFHEYIKFGSQFDLSKDVHKHFILQISLKCADLGNPCRPWNISKKWSEQICNEFYRQGDFERQLNLPVTSICDRKTVTIPKIQTDFFKNIVRPLFELWNQFLDSNLSHQLMNNLNFNNYMWNSMGENSKSLLKQKMHNSMSSIVVEFPNNGFNKRCKSLFDITSSRLEEIDDSFRDELKRKAKPKCINGCGTPPSLNENSSSMATSDKSSKTDDADFDEEDDFIADRFNDDCGAILSTPALLLPNYYLEKSYYSFSRRGSAPGCIDIHKNDLNSSKTAALFLLRNSIKANTMKRRSSFPAVKVSTSMTINSNASLHTNVSNVNVNKLNRIRGRSLELNNLKGIKSKSSLYGNKYRSKNYDKQFYRPQQSSLFDVSNPNYPATFQIFMANLGQHRRRSVPQDIFIRSLNNYPA